MNQMSPPPWHALQAEELFRRLEASADGLSHEEAARRLERHGPNRIETVQGRSLLQLAAGQLFSPLIGLLAAAAAISLLAHAQVDALVIAAVVVLNTCIGVLQEYRAERSLEVLRSMATARARVLRSGKVVSIDAGHVVPGDVLVLETGDVLAADARLLTASELRADESSFTGESEPVAKVSGVVDARTPVADRRNMLHSSTPVTAGRGRAMVVATAMQTEIGRIAGAIREVEREQTPLQRRLGRLSLHIGLAAIFLAVLVAGLGFAKGHERLEMFSYGVAVAVSCIPEGLPAVISITLALGVRRMSRQRAILRRLPAVETLGSTTVICSDKTGTITRNEMTVVRIWAGGRVYRVTGLGYAPEGSIEQEEGPPESGSSEALERLLAIGVLANNTELQEEDGIWRMQGSPTEGALLVAGIKGGVAGPAAVAAFREANPRLDELPFSSSRKFMAALHDTGEGRGLVLAKGALEPIAERCDRILLDGRPVPLDQAMRRTLEEIHERWAGQGLRLLAGAFREAEPDAGTLSDMAQGLVLAGLWALEDPPRPEIAKAIKDARRAGIRVLMLTGDHAATAAAIAGQIGLLNGPEGVLTGAELERQSDEELAQGLGRVAVFARLAPEHKLRILRALQGKGEIVAMTGDGVNDAPALKAADIGVAMGRVGTEVAREAGDMVLTDDNFATIITAVEEGRVIFANLRRVVFYLMTTSLGEVLTLLSALLLDLPLPVTAVMIIWINLITDGICDVTLGMEPKHGRVLDAPPRAPAAGIIDWFMVRRMLLLAPVMACGTLWIYGQDLGKGPAYAQTMAFVTLAAFQWFQALNARSRSQSLLAIGIWTNPWLLLAVGVAVCLQLGTVYLPVGQAAFGTVALQAADWARAMAVASSIFVLEEILKMLMQAEWLPQPP